MSLFPNHGARGALTPEQAAHLAAAMVRPDLTPKCRDLLTDLHRKSRHWAFTPKQAEAVRKIAEAPPRPDYAAINAAALARLPDVLARLLPGGRVVRGEYECADLRGGKGTSLRVNMKTGRWADFAVAGTKGGDPVSLAAALTSLPAAEAAHALARMLGMGDGR